MIGVKKTFTIKEIKSYIFETAGVPDNILECSDLLFNKIIEHLSENKNEPIYIKSEFIINGNFRIADFDMRQVKVVFNLNSIRKEKGIELNSAGIKGKQTLISNFRIKELDYSIENKHLLFKLDYSGGYTVNNIHILKFFKDNKDYIHSIISHELKHVYDDFKKPLNSIISQADYNSYQEDTNIPPLNNLVYAMYYTSNFEKTVKNTEFYSILKNKHIKKSEFNEFLKNSEEYQMLKQMRSLTFEKLENSLKNNFYEQVKNFLKQTGWKVELYTVEQNVDRVLELLYIQISNNKLNYLKDFLLNVTQPIIKDVLNNEKFYNKEKLKINNADYILFFRNKIKQINIGSDSMIKNIGKLYVLLNEDTSEQGLRINKGINFKWVNCF